MNEKIYIKNFFILIFICITAIPVVAADKHHDEHAELFNPPKVTNGTILSVKECVALAFKNSPKVRRKKYELDVAKSNVGIAKSAYFPVIGAGTGFNYERNSNSVYYDKKYRDLPYVGISVNQLVYDFGRTTANIKMEEFYKIGAEYEFVDELCHTLFDIKAKYYNVLRHSALLDLAREDVELNEGFVKIARKSPDLMTAQLNLSDAEIRYIEAERLYGNVKYDLSNSMYLDNHINYSIKTTPTFNYEQNTTGKNFIPIKFSFNNAEAAEIAYKNSPDLQVIISTKNAMNQSLKYIKRSYLPSLTAGVGYGLNHTYQTTNNSLQVGVGLSTDVNIKELKHSIDAADAELHIADNEILLFKKDLYYEVQRALNNVERTEKQVPVAQAEVAQALENMQLVKTGYKTEELDYVALQNARKDYINAKERYITSLYDYNMAIIQTEMAMHYHIVDIHHKTEHALHSHADELLEHLNEALNCDETENVKSKHKSRHQEVDL